MAGTETKRIIELTEASTVQSGDFIAVDSNARGTKKVPTDALATSAALTAETNARAGADEQMSERMDGIEEQTALIQNPTKTLSGALCSFTDGADMPMVACTAEIVPKQSGTGTPSPDNVRPISGWESVNLYKRGKNLLNMVDVLPNGSYNGDVFTCTSVSNPTAVLFDTPQNVIFSYEKGTFTGTNPRLEFWNGSTYLGNKGLTATTYTTQAFQNVTAVKFNYGAGGTLTLTKPQIELGTTATAYEPYTGTTTPVNLGRTVYGGTVDVVSGVLTVTHGYQLFDGSSDEDWGVETWSDHANYYIASQGGKRISYGDALLCNRFPSSSIDSLQLDTIFLSATGNINFSVGNVIGDLSLAEFKTWLTSNPLQVCYELEQPTTYQLTPTEIQTLLGDNNVWADSGDVEITYRRDISIVINNLESALNG